MAAGLLIFPGAFPSRDRQGDRVSAQIGFFENGTVTPKQVFADVGLTTPLANPVQSDALGNFPVIYADTTEEYTAIWSTAYPDSQSRTLDDLTASTSANQTIYDQTVAARDQTLTYRDETAQLKTDTQEALDEAEALYGDLAAVQAAVAASEAARDLSQAYRNQAEGFKDDAEAAEAGASGSAAAAAGSAAAAATSSNQAKSYTGGLGYLFSTTTTDSDPGAGNLRLNNATASAATFAYIDNQDADGLAASAWLDTFDNSSSAIKGQIFLRDGATGAFAIFAVTGAVIDGTGYRKVPISFVSGAGAFTGANRIGLAFAPNGDTPSNTAIGYVAKTANYTVVSGDWGKIIDVTSGSPTITLTSAVTVGAGFFFYAKNSGAGVATYPTIDGEARRLSQGESALIESDGANYHWIWLNADAGPHVHVRDEKTSGTGGGAASATTWSTRTLNTTLRNTIGAVLASNKITLPAGSYHIEVEAPGAGVDAHKLRLYNNTDAAVIAYGRSALSTSPSGYSDARLSFDFTLAAQKDIRIDHYTQTGATFGLGYPASIASVVEVYTVVQIWKRPQ